jgi:hypothetical protein
MLILVVHEKYGTGYYDASTPVKLAKASLAILKSRRSQGYYEFLRRY